MNIAIFADVHGRILLAFKLCARWQQETGETIDLILQAGDLGAYPDTDNLDSATTRYARKDPSELGFSEYFVEYREDVAAQLAQTACPMIFVRGNHEDHPWLDTLEKQHDNAIFPVDAYERVYCMKTGISYTFQADDAALKILGIGRIGPLPGEQDETQDKYIQPYELQRIYRPDNDLQCDVLLTHDTALHAVSQNYGMEEIRLVLDATRPAYHFHGHTEEHLIQRQDANGYTPSIKMTDLHWDVNTAPQYTLETGAMGLLRWQDADQHQFEVIDADWIQDYNARTWFNH